MNNNVTRTYIRIAPSYDTVPELRRLNLPALIRAVAEANPDHEAGPLYDAESGFVFEGRTKRFIVKETNRFLSTLEEVYCDTGSMTRFASRNQLNALLRSTVAERKVITCNGLIIIYVMFRLIGGKFDHTAECRAALSAFHRIVHNYFEDNRNDPLAEFFVTGYTTLDTAIRDNITLAGRALPYRPHHRPEEPSNKGLGRQSA